MKVIKRDNRVSFGKSSTLLVSIVMGFALAGCASKSTKDQISYDGSGGKRSGKTLEQILAEQDRNGLADWQSQGLQGQELDSFAAGGLQGEGGRRGKGKSGRGVNGRDDAFAGNEWERALLPGVDLEDSDPASLAERVAAAREHALNIARESEDPTLYAAVTGGRDLYEDLATEYALSPERLRDLKADYATNPDRDFARRGFFDEESYAFGGDLTPAERMAARVEAARRRAGLGETTEESVAAFESGATYSRVYEHDGGASSSSMLAGNGRGSGADSVAGRGGKAGSRRDRDGAVDVAMADANVKEEVVPQTLDGALPMVLGVGEQGHFEFDHYVLRDEVKARLDELAAKLQDAEFDQLDVLGFSDRIGDAAYNKSLSRKRALAVAQYLRDKGVPEYKIKVRGLGQERPVTRFEECEGLRGEDKITCLQPDRRVEIAAFIRRMNVDVQ